MSNTSEQNGRPPAGASTNGTFGRGSYLSGLSGLSIRRPVFISMVMLALIVLGLFAFRRLAIDQYPDVEIPVVTVQTVYPGASPEAVEREITRPLEEAFNPVEGVDNITSQSLEGVSLVILEFDLDRDADLAAQDVRAKISTVRREMPDDVEEPVVQTFDPNAIPILSLALSSETLPPVQLTTLAEDQIKERLQTVAGVGEVQISGGLERQIRVFVQPDRLKATGVSVMQVMAALQRQNVEIPAGRLEQENREQLVRVTGRIEDPEQFGQIIVASRNGQVIRLGDVARVEDASEEQRTLALYNGEPALALDILKVSGANTVQVAEDVKTAVQDIQENLLPAGTRFEIVRDNSMQISHSVDDTLFELILGAILTIVIVMLFLNDWKATIITSLSLPISIISAFILMGALGFTLNVVTLLALSLSIGLLIDDAIVVIENIVRHREMGEDLVRAAGWGTQEIVLAVLATTLSIVAVFVPVAFMQGIIGRFFYQFGLTVAWAVLVSLFVSFTLTPMLAAHWGLSGHAHDEGRTNFFSRGLAWFNRRFDRLSGGYRSVIGWALRHRKTTLGIAGASFVAAIALVPFIGGSFFPAEDVSRFTVQFETPEGSSLTYTEAKARQIREVLTQDERVAYTYTTVGAGATGTVTAGNVFAHLVPMGERAASQQEIMAETRQELQSLFGAEIAVLETGGPGGARAPLAVEITGSNIDVLQRLSRVVADEVRALPTVVDIQNSLGESRPEFRINVNRNEANEVGLTVGQVASAVRPFMAGQDVTTWEDPSGEERDVVVQVSPQGRTSIEDVRTLPIATSLTADDGSPITVPLAQVASIEPGTAPAQIDRKNLRRIATISGSPAQGFSVSEASQSITEALQDVELPPGYSISLGGETESLQESFGYFLETLFLAIVLIFLILASQFESITQPFAIMLSLPLSLVGVFLALLITDDTLSMSSMIGIIMLMGLVTKNAILLVDNANEQMREFGKKRLPALIEAGFVRFRPIIMTTVAMIAGMLPIALGLGEGSGFRAPMARAVIGGLITSTLLTLVVVPVAYTYFDDFGNWVARTIGWEKTDVTAPAPPEREPEPVPEPA